MNKRYMDFVPAKSANSATKQRTTVKSSSVVRSGTKKPTSTRSSITGTTARVTATRATTTRATAVRAASTARRVPATREISEVEIESLASMVYAGEPEKKNAGLATGVAATVTEAKSKKIGGRKAKAAARAAAKAAKAAKANKVNKTEKVDFDKKEEKKGSQKDAYQVPRPSFINQNRVVKRPLSKNVYRKEVKAPVEEPQGPVTIIAKPEKDSKAGLIVTIIITIILGAAAGTVAFLLLPK